MPASKFETVEDYLASLDEAKRKTMRGILDLVTTAFPGLESKLAWNTPMIHLKGKYIVGLAAYKNHLSYSPWSQAVMESFAGRLADYETTANLFKFPVDWEIDESLIKDLVTARLAEVQG